MSRLFVVAQDMILKDKQIQDANRLIHEIRAEWAKRLASYYEGRYKAATPVEGVLNRSRHD